MFQKEAKVLKQYRGTMSRRFMTGLDFKAVITASEPEKSLISILPKKSGRDAFGHVSVRHQGGRQKRFYRDIDFKRKKQDVSGRVAAIEYDPNRSANIALIFYNDGAKGYILQPEGLKVGDFVLSGKSAEVKLGNALPVSLMPIGTVIHNINGILVRGAGTGATILSKEGAFVTVKLPSSEIRLIPKDSFATVGVLSNPEWKNVVFGKAGRKRHMGIRPTVRGTAQNPRTHPHGGGEGRSGEGLKQAKTPWGKPARGYRTRRKFKHSDNLILERRKNG